MPIHCSLNIERLSTEQFGLVRSTRAALMTGCYPKRIDMATGSNFGVLLAEDTKGLNPNEITIAEVLKSAGYNDLENDIGEKKNLIKTEPEVFKNSQAS